MSALIILISHTPRTLRHAEAVLSERNHLVAALSSSDEAHVLLDSVTPDLLIADLRPGDYADLQIVVRSRVDHPDVPVIVTSAEPDEIAASEARRLGAAFIVSPLENPAFVPAVEEAIATRRRDQPPVRRWFRAPAPQQVEVHAGAERVQLVDVSAGGVRLAFHRSSTIPPTFEIAIPSAGITVTVQRVWTAAAGSGNHVWCGAAIVDGVDAQWRRFIEQVRRENPG